MTCDCRHQALAEQKHARPAWNYGTQNCLNGVCYNEKDQSFRITEDKRERKWNFQSLSPFTVAIYSLLMNYS